jgi:hypothetical protein
MWQRYGGDGRGFVLEFDAEHEFFSHRGDDKKTRKLLRKVFYRDSPIEDFWKNPYYLFSVKETSWSDEREWRMLKSLVDCQKIAIPGGQIICVLDVPPKLIKSVIFGYDFQTSFFGECTELLRKFDGAIKVQRACFDSVQGVIVIT